MVNLIKTMVILIVIFLVNINNSGYIIVSLVDIEKEQLFFN